MIRLDFIITDTRAPFDAPPTLRVRRRGLELGSNTFGEGAKPARLPLGTGRHPTDGRFAISGKPATRLPPADNRIAACKCLSTKRIHVADWTTAGPNLSGMRCFRNDRERSVAQVLGQALGGNRRKGAVRPRLRKRSIQSCSAPFGLGKDPNDRAENRDDSTIIPVGIHRSNDREPAVGGRNSQLIVADGQISHEEFD